MKGSVIAYRDLAELLGGSSRRNLVDTLDSINEKTYRQQDILLSAVVVGDNGMPDSGFFDKFRAGRWLLRRWEGRNRELDSRDIFREELAAVYDFHDAPVKVHVFIDLENTPNEGRWNALNWLKGRGYQLSGVACTKQKHRETREPARLDDCDIAFRPVPSIGSGGQEADAAILVEFGRVTHRITRRDFVCFMGSDKIYKPIANIALSEGMRFLHFAKADDKSQVPAWEPKDNKDAYRVFDINGSSKSWDEIGMPR